MQEEAAGAPGQDADQGLERSECRVLPVTLDCQMSEGDISNHENGKQRRDAKDIIQAKLAGLVQ